MVILDTSILIDHLRQPKNTATIFTNILEKMPQENFAISVITIQELYRGTSTREKDKEQDLLAILKHLKILPYTKNIAQLGGKIGRDTRHPIELPDAAIAATAIINGAHLYTLNKKDFEGIIDLELI